jgi:hypothetical protein
VELRKVRKIQTLAQGRGMARAEEIRDKGSKLCRAGPHHYISRFKIPP